MPNTSVRRGIDGKMYRNTGTYSSPTWTEIDNVRDIEMSATTQEVETTTRVSGGWATFEPTLRVLELNFQMNWDTADTTGWDAIRQAYVNNSSVEILFLDRAIATGAQGVRVHMKVYEFSIGQSNAGIQTVTVKMKPAVNPNAAPAWYTHT